MFYVPDDNFLIFTMYLCVCIPQIPACCSTHMVDNVLRVEIFLSFFLLALLLIFYEPISVAKIKFFLCGICNVLHICGIHAHSSIIYCGLQLAHMWYT